MMFNRPHNTIEDASELEVGDHIWRVLGIWPPNGPSEYIVTRSAIPFKLHPDYDVIHKNHAEYIVFDAQWVEAESPWMTFALDGNLVPGQSHNDNYWFRSESDAKFAIEYLTAQWKANPDAIAKALSDRQDLIDFSNSLYDEYDYEETD